MSLPRELRDIVAEYKDLTFRAKGEENVRILTRQGLDDGKENIEEIFNGRISSGLWSVTMRPYAYINYWSFKALIVHKGDICNININVEMKDEPTDGKWVDDIILCQGIVPLLSVKVNVRDEYPTIFKVIYVNTDTIVLLFRRNGEIEHEIADIVGTQFAYNRLAEVANLFSGLYEIPERLAGELNLNAALEYPEVHARYLRYISDYDEGKYGEGTIDEILKRMGLK